jgi:hypothetical protein
MYWEIVDYIVIKLLAQLLILLPNHNSQLHSLYLSIHICRKAPIFFRKESTQTGPELRHHYR